MANIQSKAALEASIQTLFPDNGQGEITAADLRQYLQDNLDSTNLQRSITFTMGNDNELADGGYLSIAGVPMATADTGIVAPFDLTIVQYSLARSDASASSLKYFVDGVLINTEATSTLRSTGPMLVAWPEGSMLRVQNEGSNIFNPILTVIAEYV